MRRMIRAVSATVVGVIAAAIPIITAAATPSPSPSLDSVLAKPPTPDFTELTSGAFRGEFTAHDYAVNATGATASQTEATLNRYGFVDGYGKEWASNATRHALVEIVMAFTGGQGAKNTLTALEKADQGDAHYQHPNTLAGVNPSYGVHLFDSSNSVYEDGFGFVKGNDVFAVYLASTKDDNLTPATDQAKVQFASAPDSTIPSSQWPENASTNSSAAFRAGQVFGVIVVVVLVLAVIAVGVGLVMRSRRRAVIPAYGGYGAIGAVGAPVVQMSPDANYWYEGQGWRDASLEVPPTAQRSSDGTLWWDGRTWRPVPQTGQPPQAPPTG